jgi:hypothetical protein
MDQLVFMVDLISVPVVNFHLERTTRLHTTHAQDTQHTCPVTSTTICILRHDLVIHYCHREADHDGDTGSSTSAIAF